MADNHSNLDPLASEELSPLQPETSHFAPIVQSDDDYFPPDSVRQTRGGRRPPGIVFPRFLQNNPAARRVLSD
jgi:hypothetical protein